MTNVDVSNKTRSLYKKQYKDQCVLTCCGLRRQSKVFALGHQHRHT